MRHASAFFVVSVVLVTVITGCGESDSAAREDAAAKNPEYHYVHFLTPNRRLLFSSTSKSPRIDIWGTNMFVWEDKDGQRHHFVPPIEGVHSVMSALPRPTYEEINTFFVPEE